MKNKTEADAVKIRKVKRAVAGTRARDGAGVSLVRVIGARDVADFDPFLMLDAFDSENPDDYVRGFPWHPHRGIETVTYLLEGEMEHSDSLGNRGTITGGSCQWMTAGRGIIHQEMPKASPRMLGAQLWINMPAANKMSKPAYHGIASDMIPEVAEPGARVKIVAGSYAGVKAAMQGEYVKADYLDVSLEPEAVWLMPTAAENTVFIYVVSGAVETGGRLYPSGRAVLFDSGDAVKAIGGPEGARFFALSAKPLGEPVAWGGPIVMNTKEELEKSFEEMRLGTFAGE